MTSPISTCPPVALAVDTRLQELGQLDPEALRFRLTLETNSEPRTRADAIKTILEDAAYLIPTHGWELVWDPRGIRLTHEGHTLVLGVPANAAAFVDSRESFPTQR